jgi:hypothetical protein
MLTLRPTPFAIAALAVALGVVVACSEPASPVRPSAGTSQTAATFTITGSVTDLLGTPVTDGSVSVTSGPAIGQQALVRAGAFTLSGIPAGTTTLLVSSYEYGSRSVIVPVAGNVSVSVMLPGNGFFELSGTVIRGDTSAPIEGLAVNMNGRFPATTDGMGHYGLKGLLDDGPIQSLANFVWTAGDGLDPDTEYVRSSTLDLHVYPIRHVELGTPQQVTVAPNDSVCSNNTQEPGYGDIGYVCRFLHATAPANGVVTVEVVSAAGDHFPLVVQTKGHMCCDLEFKNPESYAVVAGADVMIFVELPEWEKSSETFTVKTAFSDAAAEHALFGKWSSR